MNLSTRINAFHRLGQEINALTKEELIETCARVRNENPWFTAENVMMALKGISSFLHEDVLTQWTSKYHLTSEKLKVIGVAMAGNIPLVGFHDALCILISGNKLKAKLSSQDAVLMKDLLQRLVSIEPSFKDRIEWIDRLHNIDAMIATGGNNTARYFEYYFRNVPHIIRKNRSSCAVLTGDESIHDLQEFGKDVFSYFGLGCRNVSKIYIPLGYDFNPILSCWEKYTHVVDHHKYANNYDYQRAILLVNKIPFYDNGNIIMNENSALVSPIAVLFYEYYTDTKDLTEKIKAHRDALQCVVSSNGWLTGSIPMGTAQFPGVADYADGVDTLLFLEELN